MARSPPRRIRRPRPGARTAAPCPACSCGSPTTAGCCCRRERKGNLELSSPSVFDGYLDRPDLQEETFTSDGWYRTGDLATLDDDGFLRITGRVKDIINRGGEKLPVSEIEQLLHTHPAIADVALVAMPDPRLGERACAFVRLVPEQTLDFGGLQEFLERSGVSKHYWPERLELLAEIPRNAVGKVQKFVLRERAAELTPQTGAGVSPPGATT